MFKKEREDMEGREGRYRASIGRLEEVIRGLEEAQVGYKER
mgnify:CR=1 FL=1